MIYLGGDLQKKLIPLFHYALNPGGVLFLGTSETVGEHANLFVSVDRKAQLFQRLEDFRGGHRAALGKFLPPMTAIHATLPQAAAKSGFPAKLPLRELTERALLREVTPAGVLVNGQGDILYMHGRAGMYLELPTGEVGLPNILKMAREGLQRELAVAFHAAVATKEPVTCPGLRVKTNGHFTDVNLSVRPLAPRQVSQALEAALYLIVLEEAPPPAVAVPEPQSEPADPAMALDARLLALKLELQAKDDYLQTTKEELETSNEDLKSSNEEMQSVNEELQSTNEELETSKEELQSVNEELSTVNGELQIKVADLSRANNDMNNLLAGTGIGTIFVDLDMRILRFTPRIRSIISLIPGDVGRPVGHLVPNLVGYDRLVADVQEVLDTLVPKEVEVLNQEGLWFTMRILPYRTLNNTIEGAVLTFVDITERKRVEGELKAANELLRLAVVVRDSHDAITVQDLEGRTLAWNPGAARLYGWSEAEALAMNVHDRIPQDLREGALATLAQLSRAEVLEPYLTQRLAKDGSSVAVSIISTALMGEDGQLYAIATTERELTARTD